MRAAATIIGSLLLLLYAYVAAASLFGGMGLIGFISGLPIALAGGVLYYLGRHYKRTRACPRCGLGVTLGRLDCPHCGFDFRTIGVRFDRPQ